MEEKEAAPTGPTGTALPVPEQPTHCSALSHLNQLDHKSTIPRVTNHLCSFSQLEPGRHHLRQPQTKLPADKQHSAVKST